MTTKYDHQLIVNSKPRKSYSEWGGLDAPEQHSLMVLPQTAADGWSGHCSCSKWEAWANFYHFPDGKTADEAIRIAHAEHKNTVPQ